MTTAFDAETRSSSGIVTDATGKPAGPGSLSMSGQALAGPFAHLSLLDYYLHQSLARRLAVDGGDQVVQRSFVVSAEDQLASRFAGDDGGVKPATVTATVHGPSRIACQVAIDSEGSSTRFVLDRLEPFRGTRDVLHVVDQAPNTLPAPVDGGFKTIEFTAAAETVPYPVVLPDEPLPGFSLIWLGYAGEAAGPAGTVRDVLTAVYRNGTREIVITQHAHTTDDSVGDPYRIVDVTAAGRQAGRALPTGFEGLTLSDATAEGALPHAWGAAKGTVVSVGGDLDAAALAAAARSLRD